MFDEIKLILFDEIIMDTIFFMKLRLELLVICGKKGVGQ